MSKFYIGSKVIVTKIDENSNYENIKGIIINLFEDLKVATVDMENGDVRKVSFDEMRLDEGEQEQTEKTGIIINEDEFQKLAYEIGIEEVGNDLSLSYILGRFAGKLQEALFASRVPDD